MRLAALAILAGASGAGAAHGDAPLVLEAGGATVRAAVSAAAPVGGDTLDLKLTEEARRDLARLTQDNLSRELGLRLCGQELARMRIRAPIDSGTIRLVLPGADMAGQVADILDGRAPCSRLTP